MKVEMVEKEKLVQLKELKQGDMFLRDDVLYMVCSFCSSVKARLEEIENMVPAVVVGNNPNYVNRVSGDIFVFVDDCLVKPVNGELKYWID